RCIGLPPATTHKHCSFVFNDDYIDCTSLVLMLASRLKALPARIRSRYVQIEGFQFLCFRSRRYSFSDEVVFESVPPGTMAYFSIQVSKQHDSQTVIKYLSLRQSNIYN